ncbi:hypothetical protein [Streptomyces sp. NPDC048248]|uniref:hypothetical protein n=1 Tax=Streptomyces sp. NPDC048248 TaxID=3365523 RepID=UPI003714CA77
MFPTTYDTILQDSAEMQNSFDTALGNLTTVERDIVDRAAVTIALVSSHVGVYPTAGRNQHQEHFSASLLKVAAMYAAFELRKDVTPVSHGLTSRQEFLTALREQFNPSIREAVPRIANASAITDLHLFPDYGKVFDSPFNPSTGQLAVNFSESFWNSLQDMIGGSNAAAAATIHGLGFGYLNGALANGGFFDDPSAIGIWLAGDFQGQWPPVRISSDNDGMVAQATTTHQMANLYALMREEALVGPQDSNSMLDLLAGGATWFTHTSPQIWPPNLNLLVTHSKVGRGPLPPFAPGEVLSEGAIVHEVAHDRDFIVTWQNVLGPPTLSTLLPIARLIEGTIDLALA